MRPKVSVCMIVYNHEEFLKKAINGVLMQKTNFEVEFIISNDASSDQSEQIISQANATKNIQIKKYNHTQNMGMMANFLFALQQCTNKYIAICEGDDYWTDPLKLQKQFDILENNPDCKICFTNNSKLILNGDIIPAAPKKIPIKTGFEDILKGNYISTLTAMFLNEKNVEFPVWFKTLSIGDWPLYLWILRNNGKIYFLEEDTATYRADVGVSTSIRKNPLVNLTLIKDILEAMSSDVNFKKYKTSILEALYLQETSIMSYYMRNKKYNLGLKKFGSLFLKKRSFKLIQVFMYSIKRGLQPR